MTPSLQYVLTETVNHLVDQGKPSGYVNTNNSFVCQYRSEDGCSCAAGKWIDDAHYLTGMEDLSAQATKVQRVITASNPELVTLARFWPLMTALQNAHDAAAKAMSNAENDFVTLFLQRARKVASDFSLEMPDV